MTITLADVWAQIKELHAQGFSIIPVRDKDQEYKGKIYSAKTPSLSDWKQYQSRRPTEQELWAMMEKANTMAIAVIGGQVSGNLMIIDLDIKYYPGIDAKIFTHIYTLYPDLFNSLRIHKTPSGGYHILYRVEGAPVGKNSKLAYFEGFDKAGIETRAEGGYALMPPSLGYTVHQDVPVPTISEADHNSLLAICKGYNQKIKIDKYVKKEALHKDDYYDESPWMHFNNSPAGDTVLQDNGWLYDGEIVDFLHYTRPGKTAGTSASFIPSKRLFFFWTTSTDFTAEKCYTPSTVLSIIKFAGDRKATFRYLVEAGYGKVKPQVELKIAHKAALKAAPLPSNFSPEAKATHEIKIAETKERYPFGIFWEDQKGGVLINWELFLQVAKCLGFRLFMEFQICQIVVFKVFKCSEREFIDKLKAYIQEDEHPDYHIIVLAAYEKFMKDARKYLISRLEQLPVSNLLSSEKEKSYKFFNNCWIEITAECIDPRLYDDLTGLIWADQIQPRDFSFINKDDYAKSSYFDFLNKAIGVAENDYHLLKVIGYLAHEYKDEERGYIIILTEQCEDPLQGGGSGKNIFSTLLGHTTTLKAIPGSQVQYNERFLQSWNFERILAINDIPKKFDFLFLKNLSTNEAILKKLFKDEIVIDSKSTPKIIVSTQYSFEISDGGLKRRLIPLEFTDFFTLAGGVQQHYGKMFPMDWDQAEWLAFDNIMVHAIQLWLGARKLNNPGLTASGWIKQFEQTFNTDIYKFINSNIESWIHEKFIINETFQRNYIAYLDEVSSPKFKMNSKRFNDAIKAYCIEHKIDYQADVSKKINSVNFKGRTFFREESAKTIDEQQYIPF